MQLLVHIGGNMKLITELTEDVEYLTEAVDGRKHYFIQGPFLQGNIVNRNKRMYPVSILESEVARYTQERINENRAYGELNHPSTPTINLDRVSHMIKELRKDGNNFVGKAKILDTPMGKIVQNLLDEGARIGVSSRATGSVAMNNQGIQEVQKDFRLSTAADIVADPSAPQAFVRGIMEGVNWIFDAATGSWQAEQLVETTRKQGKILTEEEMMQKFEKFLSFLGNNK